MIDFITPSEPPQKPPMTGERIRRFRSILERIICACNARGQTWVHRTDREVSVNASFSRPGNARTIEISMCNTLGGFDAWIVGAGNWRTLEWQDPIGDGDVVCQVTDLITG